MADILADLKMRARYIDRTQAAFVRSLKFLTSGRMPDHLPQFNVRTLPRLHDFNPPIYVCAITLLDTGVETDPAKIRESPQFRTLIDRLGLQPSSTSRDVKNSHRASLVLLEVFIYMILLNRARIAQQENRVISGGELYEDEELTR